MRSSRLLLRPKKPRDGGCGAKLKTIYQMKRVRKSAHGIAVIGILAFAFLSSACSQFNFPYNSHTKLAVLQARLGFHSGSGQQAVQIIGHRGSGLPAVEEGHKGPIGNTEEAIEGGIKAGRDWIEIDLQRSYDRELVLFHDEEIDAKTTGSGAVSELTVAELLACDVSVMPAEKILTLEDFEKRVLRTFTEGEVGLILDIKEKGLKDDVLRWLNKAKEKGLRPETVIIFGEYEVLKEYRESGYKLGYTFTWKNAKNRSLFLFHQSEIIKRLKKVEAGILVVPVIFTSKSLVERAEKEGVKTWTYGSDDKRDWDKLRAIGVTGLIVDSPKEAVDHLDPAAARHSTSSQDAAD